jgi:hypothetical protein
MREAVFCLCPSGFAQWSQRFYQAAALGCLPVTFWDPRWPNAMPFEREIDYAVAADAPTTAADPTQEPAATPRRGKKPRKKKARGARSAPAG